MFSTMNSLNILSGLTTTPPNTPPRSRSGSNPDVEPIPSIEGVQDGVAEPEQLSEKLGDIKTEEVADERSAEHINIDEKTPLLSESSQEGAGEKTTSHGWRIHRRLAEAIINSFKVVYTTITAPGRYVIACFYDEQGHFSAILPIRNFKNLMLRRKRKASAAAVGLDNIPEGGLREEKVQRRTSHQRSPSVESNSSATSYGTSDAETDREKIEDSPSRHTRSKTAASKPHERDEIKPQNKSIRIKLHNDEALRRRKAQKAAAARQDNPQQSPTDLANALKSPSSSSATSSSRLTRYPRTPAPPRPLVPRRQPSYSLSYTPSPPKKTLVIDLDETLIHSMAKGGRMSTGHMVEVRLTPPSHQPGGPSTLHHHSSSSVPILYYVHERPHCHEFLRKVCKWYNCVIFTASVQEYADPVIDWLERERKYFTARYYRGQCTYRNGAYVKDLAVVEPDLSRVMVLDNSPMSYVFHEDNAIPIEGWISDPTDNDLLHLIPLLEGLQYVTDVRALLALRQGMAAQA